MTRQSEWTTCRVAGTVLALVVCALFPGVGHAELSHDALWGATAPSACSTGAANFGEVSAVFQQKRGADQMSSDRRETVAAASDCLNDGSRRSNNVCFEEAGVPASVVPALSARVRALQESESLVDRATDIIGVDPSESSDQPRASRTQPIQIAPPAPPAPNNRCTAQQRQRCRSLPPLPPSLTLEASASAPYLPDQSLDVVERQPIQETTIPEQLRIRPSDGYRSPPLKPPRG